jgi:leader peptidase (prepilin peptidase)/N-methyltransferase
LSAAAVVVAAWAVAAAPGWHALAGVALGWTLLALSAVDLRFMILPDVLTLPLIPAGIAVATLSSGTDATAHAIGAAVGGGVLFVFAESYRLLRGRDGLGLGDAKLFAAAGAWVGWSALPSVLLIAAASGLAAALVLAALRRRNGGVAARPLAEFALPFGPFLGVGLWLTWLYGPLEFAWV